MYNFILIVTLVFPSLVTSQRPLINNSSPVSSTSVLSPSLSSSSPSSSSSLNYAYGHATLPPMMPAPTSTLSPPRPNSIAIPPISYPSGRERLQKQRGYNKFRQFLTTVSPLGLLPPDRSEGRLFQEYPRQRQHWNPFTGNGTEEPFPEIKKFAPSSPPYGKSNAMHKLRKTIYRQPTQYASTGDGQSDDPLRIAINPIVEPLQSKTLAKFNGNTNFPAFRAPPEDNIEIDIEEFLGVKCNFEHECAWKWETDIPDGFHVVTGESLREQNMTGLMPGPEADPANDAYGHFLHVRITKGTTQRILRSPQFSTTRENCYLEAYLHQSSMAHGSIRVVIEPLGSKEGSWVPSEIVGNDFSRWNLDTFRIGRISKDFQILFEVVPNTTGETQRGHVSIDNLRMKNCFPEGAKNETCNRSEVKCSTNRVEVCIDGPRICDINVDCDENEDELLNCDKIPFGARCDFENGWCGWHNSDKPVLMWSHHSGPTPTDKTGPNTDHTYQHTNITGYYMCVNMNQHANDTEKRKYVGFASNAIMNSVVFNPPPFVHSNITSPYQNSCMVRFHVHQFGMNAGSINLSVVEMREKENFTTTLWWSSKNLGDDWLRREAVLPNITSKYFLQFEARMGMRIYSDVAVDDISLSPECFGINIPAEHLQPGYNYWDPRIGVKKEPHKDFENKTVFEFTTCGSRGIHGPTKLNCSNAYNNTYVMNSVKVLDDSAFKGMQVWKVPNEGYYTLIAKGAGGGLGSGGIGSSRGAISTAVLELHKNEELYLLVGQAGEHACIKSIGYHDEGCEITEKQPTETYHSKTDMVRNIVIEDGAGGGGGGSFIYLLNSAKVAVPLLVAGGGGGLGLGRYLDDDFQHGQGLNANKSDTGGRVYGETNNTAGPGGGWRAQRSHLTLAPRYGAALLEGGRGGVPCYDLRGYHGQGGFGGGGGGCRTGGGGGGYSGGSSFLNISNGEGGSSYIGLKRSIRGLSGIYEGANSGPGSVVIIPAVVGCGCDYRCIALDEYRSVTQCICPEGWRLKNNTACEWLQIDRISLQYYIIFFAGVTILLITALTSLILILYNRYQRKKQAALRHKMLLEQDLQLSRLRHNADDSALTNFNPNYGCDGILNGNVDVKTLPQVARESLRLVKALGQGAFGEVYQGLYRHRDGDAVEMPVAVKTLPELSTGQAETDFLMEAAIMAKFNHPNIVHLIGVCFDRHPRFIVLELLAGGDLKNFLREGRNKPERPSALTMKDLVFCALDVAKGCRYMESKRFIHRDIAARNCLLSSKGPGRVVKIADFGMARDIYRSDYYRKGGKAMLPIKWMPPEAFLDGIFTSKTDVWSFGVLLWEVFSLGLMPYTGLPNREVMNLVTHGGRLDSPPGCPQAIYRIMVDCWNPLPDERPPFSSLLERLTACTQDPDVMNAPLPSITHHQAHETDTTIVRPPCNDEFCLQVPNSSDYLIPLPDARSTVERLMNEATGVTLSETAMLYAPPVMTSPAVIKCHDENGGCWETSFMMSNSRSDQPLIGKELHQNGIDAMPNHNHYHHKKPPQHNAAVQATSEDYQPTLISLDTPQQTPTTIKPPMSFAQIDGITLDPAALNKNQNNGLTQHQPKMSYANVQMLNSIKNSDHNGSSNHQTQSPTEKMNGNGNNTSFDGSSSTISASSAPFAIQGFNDRYITKDNHSEISC